MTVLGTDPLNVLLNKTNSGLVSKALVNDANVMTELLNIVLRRIGNIKCCGYETVTNTVKCVFFLSI